MKAVIPIRFWCIMGKKNKNSAEEFPHFRRYNKSGHPALILGEVEDDYKFRRVTSLVKRSILGNILTNKKQSPLQE